MSSVLVKKLVSLLMVPSIPPLHGGTPFHFPLPTHIQVQSQHAIDVSNSPDLTVTPDVLGSWVETGELEPFCTVVTNDFVVSGNIYLRDLESHIWLGDPVQDPYPDQP